MHNKKKKGQISIEILLVLSILVIGSVLFGVFYFSQIRSNSKTGDELSGLLDDFITDLNPNHPGPGPGNYQCGNNICEIEFGENNTNCPTDCYCGDGFCLSPLETPGDSNESPECNSDCGSLDSARFDNLNLTLIPNSPTEINTNFKIKVSVDSTYDLGVVGKLEIMVGGINGTPTENCAFNGSYASSFKNIGYLRSSNDPNKIDNEFTFSCNAPGSYTFQFSEINPNGLTTYNLLGDIEKTIVIDVSGNTNFSISITSPNEGDSFFVNSNIHLIAENIGQATGPVKCFWYIGERYIDTEAACDFSYTYPESLGLGEKQIIVYATTVIDGTEFQSRDSRNINIYESTYSLSLSVVGSNTKFVGEEFYLKASSLNQDIINLITNPTITFDGSICNVDNTGIISGSDNINGADIYYKKIPVTCLTANYSAPDTLEPVTASLDSATVDFFVGYDTTMNFANCNTFGSEYTIMNVCAFSTGGVSFNSDYWNNPYDAFLSVGVNLPKNTTINNGNNLMVSFND